MLSVHTVISLWILILNVASTSKIASLAEDLIKGACLLALLDAADWDQGVLSLHQVVL